MLLRAAEAEVIGAPEISSAAVSVDAKKPVPKRRPGRPKGSRNRNTEITRAIVNGKEGIAALKLQVRVAAGLPVKRPLKGGGYETVIPEWSDVLATGRELMKYQLPALKSQEIDQLVTHTSVEPRHNPRQVARAILSALAQAVPGGKITIEEPGTRVSEFSNPNLGKRLLPGGNIAEAGDLASELVDIIPDDTLGEAPCSPAVPGLALGLPTPSPASDDEAPQPGDQHHPFDQVGAYAQFEKGGWLAIDRSGNIRSGPYAALDDAIEACRVLSKARAISAATDSSPLR